MAQLEEHNQSAGITTPDEAHIRRRSGSAEFDDYLSDDSLDREATELREVRRDSSSDAHGTTQSSNLARGGFRRIQSSQAQREKRFQPLRKFWRHQISVTVPHDHCRDHLALERTFLGWLRTALSLSIVGVTVAQLFRLQVNDEESKLRDETYHLGVVISAVFIVGSMIVVTIGGYRFWKQQNAMVRGKIHKGGWEIWSICTIWTAVLVALLAVTMYAGTKLE